MTEAQQGLPPKGLPPAGSLRRSLRRSRIFPPQFPSDTARQGFSTGSYEIFFVAAIPKNDLLPFFEKTEALFRNAPANTTA